MPRPDLQAFGSWTRDILSRKRGRGNDSLCSVCTGFGSDETPRPFETYSRPFEIGLLSEVTNRVRDSQCPLCRVALHVVSQALASPTSQDIWPDHDFMITIEGSYRQRVVQGLVSYNQIGVGRIVLHPRNLHLASESRIKNDYYYDYRFVRNKATTSGVETLRYAWKEFFGRSGIISVCYSNIRIRAATYISRVFDVKTTDYHFYANIQHPLPLYNIDRSFVLSAINTCETTHHDTCVAPFASTVDRLQTEILLIDVIEARLVKTGIHSQKYLALSYVWGKTSMFKTLVDNLASLQQPGCLLALRGELPRVLQDSMKFTQYLGERYLWCDALCIVQDDTQFKHSQIALMDLVYNQAFLTICALSGSDASVGLLGFSESAPAGLPLDEVGCTDKFAIVSSPPDLEDIAHLLPYERRGWTFQERVLSRRCLFFTAMHLYFQCGAQWGLRTENGFGRLMTTSEALLRNTRWNALPKHLIAASPLWGPHYYQSLVQEYTMRQLTYPEDIIDAFTAICSTVEKLFSSRIRKGIFEATMSSTLCWTGLKILTRRATCSDKSLWSSQTFPSWSWCGWEGPVTFILLWYKNKVIEEGVYLSYVSMFMLEEGEDVEELKEGPDIQHHEKASQTPIPFSPTGKLATLHFMAHCVDSTAFCITSEEAKDGLLYVNKSWNKLPLERQNESTSPALTPQGLVSSSELIPPTNEPCGVIWVNDPELLPLHGVLAECKFILISTMTFGLYGGMAWSTSMKHIIQSQDPESRYYWGMNAILIQERNGFWERIGFAFLTQQAWDNADPREEYVQLV